MRIPLGESFSYLSSADLDEHAYSLVWHMYDSTINRAPMQANTSHSFQLDKGKMLPGPGGLRLIHCFDVFWRRFYRHLRER
eukprot:8283404-Pyramimonas_sp.AAC.1